MSTDPNELRRWAALILCTVDETRPNYSTDMPDRVVARMQVQAILALVAAVDNLREEIARQGHNEGIEQ